MKRTPPGLGTAHQTQHMNHQDTARATPLDMWVVKGTRSGCAHSFHHYIALGLEDTVPFVCTEQTWEHTVRWGIAPSSPGKQQWKGSHPGSLHRSRLHIAPLLVHSTDTGQGIHLHWLDMIHRRHNEPSRHHNLPKPGNRLELGGKTRQSIGKQSRGGTNHRLALRLRW